jgi:hypothetical protein
VVAGPACAPDPDREAGLMTRPDPCP